MSDLKHALRQIWKRAMEHKAMNLFQALAIGPKAWGSAGRSAGWTAGGPGGERAHPCDLGRIDEVPVRAHPDDEQVGFRRGGYGEVLRMRHRQRFPVGEVDLEGAERSPVAEFPDIADFHESVDSVRRPGGIINVFGGGAGGPSGCRVPVQEIRRRSRLRCTENAQSPIHGTGRGQPCPRVAGRGRGPSGQGCPLSEGRGALPTISYFAVHIASGDL